MIRVQKVICLIDDAYRYIFSNIHGHANRQSRDLAMEIDLSLSPVPSHEALHNDLGTEMGQNRYGKLIYDILHYLVFFIIN